MADPAPTSIGQWRRYFRSINTDIFNIIEHALMLAAKDYPYDFKIKRDRIAEVLFACKITKCLGCEQIELAVPVPDDGNEDDELEDEENVAEEEADGHVLVERLKKKEICNKTDHAVCDEDNNSDTKEEHDCETIKEAIQTTNNNIQRGDGNALSVDEEEDELLREVLKIKQVLDDKSEEETTDEQGLIDCLERLKLMKISLRILRDSRIGRSVNDLYKQQRSVEITRLAGTLVKDWMAIVDEHCNNAQAATTEAEQAKKRLPIREEAEEEEEEEGEEEEEEEGGGLPSPQLDDLEAVLATAPTMPLSNFFDGIDEDDLNDHASDLERKKKPKTVRKAAAALARRPPRPPPHNNNNNNNNNSQQQQLKKQAAAPVPAPPKLKKAAQQMKAAAGRPRKNAPAAGRPKPLMSSVRTVLFAMPSANGPLAIRPRKPPGRRPMMPPPSRPSKPVPASNNIENNGPLVQPAKVKAGIAVKPKPPSLVIRRPQREKPMNYDDEESMQKKLEVAKRKLHERYEEAEKAKRQRTTQVVPLCDLPKKKIIERKNRRQKIVRGTGANNS